MNRLSQSKKFVLPSQSLWEVATSSISGMWSYLSDPGARNEFEKLVSDKVIKTAVLAQARQGHLLSMSLFHNLRHPLFRKNNFDAVEFMDAVVPALETFQDTLGRLVRETNQSPLKYETAAPTENAVDPKKSEESVAFRLNDSSTMLGALDGSNTWRQIAREQPDSLAARLAKMTTDRNFDDHFYGAKLFQALTAGAGGSNVEYIPGSGAVGQVALLDARVMEISEVDPDDLAKREHPEFAASDDTTSEPPVAARIDILYEITQSFQEITTNPLSTSEQYKSMDSADNSKSTPPPSESTASSESDSSATGDAPLQEGDTTRKTTETSLAVAVFEGWFKGGPDKALRWKVAMIRDAYEFT